MTDLDARLEHARQLMIEHNREWLRENGLSVAYGTKVDPKLGRQIWITIQENNETQTDETKRPCTGAV
jgi:hypothetical protein